MYELRDPIHQTVEFDEDDGNIDFVTNRLADFLKAVV